jgi:hypothetical protein
MQLQCPAKSLLISRHAAHSIGINPLMVSDAVWAQSGHAWCIGEHWDRLANHPRQGNLIDSLFFLA